MLMTTAVFAHQFTGLHRHEEVAADVDVGDVLAAVEFAAGDDHVGTLLGQQFGDGFTDATAGAGDESVLAAEVERRASSSIQT